MTDKAVLRRRYAALRDALTPDLRAKAEAAVQDLLFSLPAWKNAPLICGYMSMRSELDTTSIWHRAITEGKSYALPVTVTDAREGRMVFRRLTSYAPHKLITGRFGLSEPTDTCPILQLRDLEGALVIVPGLAFDDGGFRIGYGGGYYDRFLAALDRAKIRVTTVGLAFSVCRAAALPHEIHDYPIRYIIDERKVSISHGAT